MYIIVYLSKVNGPKTKTSLHLSMYGLDRKIEVEIEFSNRGFFVPFFYLKLLFFLDF